MRTHTDRSGFRKGASLEFSLVGGSAQMFLRLEDGVSSQIVNASATMRNP